MARLVPDELRCPATAKGTGVRCQLPKLRGAPTCWKHGSGAPQVRRAAARRVEAARVQAELAKLVGEMPSGPEDADVDPLEVLVTRLAREARMAGVADQLVDRLATAPGTVDAEGRPIEALYGPDHLGDLRPHPLIGIGQRWSDDAARHAKLALDAGVEERLVALEERQVAIAAEVVFAVLADFGHDVTELDVRSRVAAKARAIDAASAEVAPADVDPF